MNNPNHSIDVEAERKLFEAWADQQGLLRHACHSFWEGWLAAKRSIAQAPTSEAVATVLYWQTERSAGWEFNWLGKPPAAGTEIDLFAAPVPVAQPAADPAPVPANTGTIDTPEFLELLNSYVIASANLAEYAKGRRATLIAHIDARLNAKPEKS